VGIFLGKLFRVLIYSAATLVILLALLVGLIRLLLPQLPAYQQEVRDAAAAATGFDIQFVQLSASWPLRGPELVLYEVLIEDPDTGETLARSDQVSVGIDLLTLLLERRIVPASVGVSGTRLNLERNAQGVLELQGLPLEDWVPDREEEQPQLDAIVLRLRDIDIRYRDALASGGPVRVSLENLDLELKPRSLVADGKADVSGAQRGRIEFAANAQGRLLGEEADPLAAVWQVSLEAEDLDLPPLAELLVGMPTPLRGASGEIALVARFEDRQPRAAMVNLDLRDMEFGSRAQVVERLDSLSGRLEWEQQEFGWLLGATDLRLGRNGRVWPRTEATLNCTLTVDEGSRDCRGAAGYVRLDDLYAVVRGFASPGARVQVLPRDVRGEVRDLRFSLVQPPAGSPSLELSLNFSDLGVIDLPGGITAAGLTGEVVADQSGGRLELDSRDGRFSLPELFEGPLQADTVSGLLVWRITDEGVRVLSDSVKISAGDINGTSRFELLVPADGRSSFLDLDARVRSASAPAVLDFLPLRRFPDPVSRWLRKSIVAGRVEDAALLWRGPLRAFPYERGEGQFRVDLSLTEGVLDYADGWPALEDLTADVIFDGVSLSTTRNRGRLANLEFTDQSVGFDDLRNGFLAIDIEQPTEIMELRQLMLALPVSEALDTVFTRIQGSGAVDASLSLALPVKRPQDYQLNARFDAKSCDLGFDGLAFQLDEIRGVVELNNARLSADGLDAVLLGEPVRVQLRPAGVNNAGHSHFALLSGRTPMQRWIETLDLPQADKFSGPADWRAMVALPSGGEGSRPLQVAVTADLTDVESRLPSPFRVAAGEAAPLNLQVEIDGDALNVEGQLRDDLAWIMRLESGIDGWAIERGAVHSGYGPALLPLLPGIELSGQLEVLRLADWLAIADNKATARWLELYREVAFTVDDLIVFGQHFADAELLATRQPGAWRIAVDAPWVLGTLIVPDQSTPERPLQVTMERLWLLETEDVADEEPTDPREVPPIGVQVQDFRLGELRFGRLDARGNNSSDGLVVSPIKTSADSFQITGDAAWLVSDDDVNRQRTRLRAELESTDVKNTLLRLGYQPLLEGKSGRVKADISWPGGPAADFLTVTSGQVEMRVKNGALLEVEPGGSGRVLGMLSVAALPRRLSLDFSDVFDEGLSFETLAGNFTIESGEAYTCNLGLEGAVADVGIVGRTSISNETYDQLAVVRPHVSNVLALGGAVVGGPGVGAAMLLISRIFRKPLSQIGESYYEIQGSWDGPDIGKIQRIDVDTTRFSNCEALLPEVVPEAVLVPLPDAPAQTSGAEDSGNGSEAP
jgi:uncharacterized protein (TIGR02099 family)